MQPIFQIIADSEDITAKIKDRLLRLSVVDERGQQSDQLEIQLDDRDNAIALVATGVLLEVALGKRDNNGKTALHPMGWFTVDEIELSGPPDSYTIRAKAADMRATMKQQRTRNWDDTTIAAIVATIAQLYSLQPRVSPTLGQIQIPHLAQTEESDLHLLTRLAREHDAVTKPANGFLLFVPKGEARTASGKQLPPTTIYKHQCSRWRVVMADRSKYSAVITHWQNTETGVRTPERVGSGEPIYTLRGTRKDKAAAQQAAKAKLSALQRGASTGDFQIKGGELALMAEAPVTLAGWREGINGNWVATRVEHRLDNNGLLTLADVETPKR